MRLKQSIPVIALSKV